MFRKICFSAALFCSFPLMSNSPYIAISPITYSGTVSTTVPWGPSVLSSQAGLEIANIQYTPAWSTNKLIISVQIQGESSQVGSIIISLCQDNVDFTIGRVVESVPNYTVQMAKILRATWIVDATNTTSRTYRIKLGSSSGSSFTVYPSTYSGHVSLLEATVLPNIP